MQQFGNLVKMLTKIDVRLHRKDSTAFDIFADTLEKGEETLSETPELEETLQCEREEKGQFMGGCERHR